MRPKKVKRSILAICLMLALAMSMVAGCGSGTGESSGGGNSDSGEGGSQLNVAAELFPASLEPATDWESWYVVRFGAGETLTIYDDEGNVQPWLATDWEVADDELTWTVTLKEGVKFSNGEEMTATKVVESIERLYDLEDTDNGGTGNPQGYFTYSSLTADDVAGTVTIVTDEPTPDMPGILAYPWMLIVDAQASSERNVATEGPICTGAYAFESFTQDSDVQMVKNEYYYEEVPFDTVSIMKVSESATRVLALQDGSVDVALNIAASDRPLIEGNGYTITEIAGTRTGYAHLNFEGVLSNDSLREAVLMAIDGQTIADVTTSGAYTYGFTPIPSSIDYGYDELSFAFSYDPDAAAAVLDGAGIVDSDGDGYRELDGEMIDLNYVVTSNRQMDVVGQAQASQLEKIGIKCTVTVTEKQADVLNNHLFDLCCSNEVVTPTGDPAKFMSHWYSKSDDNYSGYSNPDYDATYELLKTEFDTDTRREYIIELQQMLLDDAAVLTYGYFNYNICTVDDLTGVYISPNDFYWVYYTMQFN